MTREEAIEILRHYDDLVWQDKNKVTMGMVADAIRMGEEALQSPWKSVKEELPKCDIFLCDRYETVTAHYNADNGGYFIGGRFPDIYTVTAIRDMWLYFMPIPELPKGKEEQK